MNIKPYSLRLRLLALVGGPVVLAGIVIAGLTMMFTYDEINEVYDAQLAQAAKLLLQLTQREIMDHEKGGLRLGAEAPDFSHLYEENLWFRIWQNGRLITQSLEADAFSDSIAPAGFSQQDIKGVSWRFFVYVDKKTDITVEVAENNEIRMELLLQILGSLLVPGLIFLPLIMLIVWSGTTRSLRPIKSITSQLNLRGAHDLSPLRREKAPDEIAPFVSALNRLFLRVNETFQREREFTDNAAHELRTPLAAMKTQAQVLMKKAAGMPDCEEGLDNLLESIDRAGHMVGQLLAFARLQSQNDAREKVDFSLLAEDALRELHPLALQRGQSLEVEIEPRVGIQGFAGPLSVLLRNLVDNAIKYAPEGGHIKVSLSRDGSDAVLAVSDDGPGVPEEQQEKIFERFYRVNKGAGTGSGLGLAMVRWVADMHDASIKVENARPGGLVIRVIFSENPKVAEIT